MRRFVAAGIVFLLIVAAASGGWFLLRGRLEAGSWPPQVAVLEEALALPGLLGLAAVDLRDLRRLQRLSDSDFAPTADALADASDPSWPERMRSVGIDWQTNVDHVLAGFYVRPEGGFGVALAAFGSFSASELEKGLRESPDFEVDTALLHGKNVLQLMLRDRATCDESGPWLLHAGSDRVLLGDPDTLEAILDPSRRSASASRELGEFREFRKGRIASLALFLPEELPSSGNPMLGIAAAAAMNQLDGFRSLQLGAGVRWLPPGLELASVFEASGEAVATKTADDWKRALDASRARLSDEVPVVAALLGALEISVRGQELWVETQIDPRAAGELQKLPAALASAAFGGGLGQLAAAAGGASPSEQLDSDPRRFLPAHAVEAIEAYDASLAFAGEVDSSSGPFGFRLRSLSLPLDPAQGIEVEIEALGTGLTNLGEKGERAQLWVTSVLGRSGEQLLKEELCGADRNDLPIALTGQGAPSPVVGTKRIRLAPGATQGDIAFIEGHVKLVYPTRTETVRLSAASEGARAEREGARLEISGASGGQVGWKLEGRSDRMLHLRALNAGEQPLMQQSAMQMGSAFGMGSGVSGSTEFAGKVAHVEAVFAVEEEAWEFPFSLTHMRPGTSREQTVVDAQELSKFPIDRIRRELAAATRDLTRQVASHSQSETRAGPFVVALESVWSFRGLMPRFQVRAPEIAPLEQSLSALELSLREIQLKDGTTYAPQPGDTSRWSQILVLAETWGGEGLRADASLETRAEADGDQVAALSGALVLRLPREVSTLQMPEVVLGAEVEAEGFSAVVSEIARDRFVLRSREGGDRVLAVRAYNADGDSLWMTGAKTARTEAGWQGEFGVQGVPARVELVVAKDLETAEYPFSMTLAAN